MYFCLRNNIKPLLCKKSHTNTHTYTNTHTHTHKLTHTHTHTHTHTNTHIHNHAYTYIKHIYYNTQSKILFVARKFGKFIIRFLTPFNDALLSINFYIIISVNYWLPFSVRVSVRSLNQNHIWRTEKSVKRIIRFLIHQIKKNNQIFLHKLF